MTALVVATHVWPATAEVPIPTAELALDWGGPVGDRHCGLTMSSDARQKPVFERGTEIKNHRQVSIVDVAELATIAANLGIETIDPGIIADNICTSGLPELTALPPMTRLVFSSGAVLLTGGENTPCTIAGRMVAATYGARAEAFPKAAMGLRGITGWVEHPGIVRAGDSITLQPY
jgi:hypothetical protein